MKNNNQTNLTVFGEETVFQGVLEYTDNLVITGKFEGTIKSSGNLEIAKTAVCTVDSMSAKDILIAGTVKGNISAESKIEMTSGSKISARPRLNHGYKTYIIYKTDIWQITLT